MAWRYTGDGRWIPGVPARDLTDEEMDAAEESYPGTKASGIYEESDDKAHPRIAREVAALAAAHVTGGEPVYAEGQTRPDPPETKLGPLPQMGPTVDESEVPAEEEPPAPTSSLAKAEGAAGAARGSGSGAGTEPPSTGSSTEASRTE